MIRLVKGAYWDSEIKRAQVEGLEGYPVYTRKVYTDVLHRLRTQTAGGAGSHLPAVRHPQRPHPVGHLHIAGQNYYPGQYEFQCLHGMGEPLYEQVVGKVSEGKLNRPCRVYAPVGTTKPCWPTWSAACWKTAPTPRSSTASPTIRSRSRSWSPTRWPASSDGDAGRRLRPAAPAHPAAA
jgi:hypothetical protein